MWTIEFFKKDNGRCPTDDFLGELSPKTDQPHIFNAFKQLKEHGNRLRRPQVEYLGDDIYELRVKTLSGQFRFFYFFYVGNSIVVTHGIKKKTQKVPEHDLKLAKEYRRIHYDRHGIKP
jgi:phage-related protein